MYFFHLHLSHSKLACYTLSHIKCYLHKIHSALNSLSPIALNFISWHAKPINSVLEPFFLKTSFLLGLLALYTVQPHRILVISVTEPWHFDTDPYRALFLSGFQDENNLFCFLFTVGTFTSVFKDNKLLENRRTLVNKCSLIKKFSPLLMEESRFGQQITDLDPEHCE